MTTKQLLSNGLLAALVVATAYWAAAQQSPSTPRHDPSTPPRSAAQTQPADTSGNAAPKAAQEAFPGAVKMSMHTKQLELDAPWAKPYPEHEVQLTAEEWEAVRQAAEDRNESISEFIRQRLLSINASSLQDDEPMS